MPVSLIIAAGGSSSRFRSDLPARAGARALARAGNKLLYPLAGKPVLARTISEFQSVRDIREVIVALPQGMERFLRAWVKLYAWKNVKWVRGGETRAASVRNALKKTSPRCEWVMVQDGARPFVPQDALGKLMRALHAQKASGAVIVHKIVPTIKRAGPEGSLIQETVDRRFLYGAETPQLAMKKTLLAAYRQNERALEATDEASLLESIGEKVAMVVSDSWNPKITTYHDMELAEALMSRGSESLLRTGIGWDVHRLVPGRKLYLGGVQVPFEKGALGHSDADVLLHAVADAMLGAAAMGDIGEHFPDRDKRYKNMRSEKIIRSIVQKLNASGWGPAQIDANVILERPKLGRFKKEIRRNLAVMLGLKEKDVSVKAKTAEGLGPEGTGQSISAQAVAVLKRVEL